MSTAITMNSTALSTTLQPTNDSVSAEHLATCLLAAELSQSNMLSALLIIKLVLSILGAVLTLILLRLELRYMLAHPNVTILLINHNVALVGACAMYCYKSISKLADYMGKGVIGQPACLLTTDKHHCATSNYPKSICYCACVFALIVFAFERLVATIKYGTYENKAKKKFGFALVVFQVRNEFFCALQCRHLHPVNSVLCYFSPSYSRANF